MPPTDDIEKAVEQILHKFDQNLSGEEDGGYPKFWDYWLIGGRWGGNKLLASLDDEKIKEFMELLTKEGITVSSVSPASQADRVNELWNQAFPNSPVKECPLFDNYAGDFGDVMKWADLPVDFKCGTVIIAEHHWDDETRLDAGYMLMDQIWNGVTHQKTAWDGSVHTAMKQYLERLDHMSEEHKAKNKPTPDWVCVTVDYHS